MSNNTKTRTKSTFNNMVASLISNSFSIIIGLISRLFFIKILGNEFLGLNGLLSNVVSMLCIVELGIGSAIIYSLYKPIANDDYDTIKSLMLFYKKCYRVIGFLIFFLGIIVLPFIPYFIGNTSLNINIYFSYLLFLLDAVFSYFLSYKRSLIYAQQKDYILQYIHLFYLFFLNFFQVFLLFFTKNYYLFLFIKIIFRVLENIVICLFANKLYPYLLDKNVNPLNSDVQNDIFKKIKALFFHQIGSFVINGTDNIIISKFLGLSAVGLYSNYYLVINSVRSVTKQIIGATTPSVGNLLVTESSDKQFCVFDRIRFINFWIACFCSICLYVLMDPFITIWIGKEFVLDKFVLFVLCINFYQKTMRDSFASFKSAAGIFYEDRFIPLLESFLNIVFSIIFVCIFGLAGVFIGTVVSGLILWLYRYPILVYKKLFNRSYFSYLYETLSYIIIFLILLFITVSLSSLFVISNTILYFGICILLCLFVPNMIIIILFYNNVNFKYVISFYYAFIDKFRSKFFN